MEQPIESSVVVDLSPMEAMSQHAREAAELMKALSNEHRLMVLCVLMENELSVSDLNAKVLLSQSALSQHLAWLRKLGLVSTRREAQTIYYRLNGDRAQRVIAVLKDIFCPY